MTAPKTRFVGLVDASPAGGVSDGTSNDWRLVLHLAAWREPDGPVFQQEIRCELQVAQDELNALMDEIEAYSIVELEAASSTDGVIKLRRIISTTATDTELASIGRELQKPIELLSPFGRLSYDRQFGWYAGSPAWCGKQIEIHLSCADPAQPVAVLKIASELFSAQSKWNQRVQEYAVETLLELKNDTWLSDDEEPLTADDFTSRMTLTSIEIEENGAFTFWHDDGDLFWGHSIQISGDVANGPARADIPG